LRSPLQRWQTLAQSVAGTLIVLTLLPFTAPFPAYDFSTLAATHFPGSDRQTSTVKLLADSSSHALPISRPSARIRIVALATSRCHSNRLPLLSLELIRIGLSTNLAPPQRRLSALRI
jgi:hypothetical protein